MISVDNKKEGLLPRRISAVHDAHLHESTHGATTVRILGFACGMGLMSASVLLWTKWIIDHRFSFFELFVSLLGFGVGIVSFILESNCFFIEESKKNMINAIPYLGQVSGRGALYTGVGLLQCSVFHALHLFVGLFTAIVGLYMINIGQQSAKSLAILKKSIKDENALKEAFQANDQNGDGILEKFEFDSLMLTLGVELDNDELEAAFCSIDTNNDKRIVYDEFRLWWKGCTAEVESVIV